MAHSNPFSFPACSVIFLKDLLQTVKTKKTELLFLALFIKLLKPGGRCACIVPDGVLFGSSTAHKDIRKAIIDGQKLDAIISMPSGVFKPYAGVSTAVMFFTRTDSGGTDRVWFYDMQADGFSLDDKRAALDRSRHENDNIPDIVDRWNALDAEAERSRTEQSFFVSVSEIRENGYDLSINRYKAIISQINVEKKVFISYSRLDKDIAEKFCHELEKKGFSCWIFIRVCPLFNQ